VSFGATPGAPGVLPVSAQVAATGADAVRAGACVTADLHDLAVLSLKAPKSVKVPAGGSATASVDVEIQNLSSHPEHIADAGVLADLVTLAVTPTGAGCATPAVALDPKASQKLPLDLAPQKKLKVAFDVTIDCADTDYTCSGHVDHAALDGLPDSVPGNDTLGGVPIDTQAK
jgi:hypothetical protein